MSFKYGMLCVVLFIMILLLAIKNYDVLTQPLELIPDQGAAKKSEARTENPRTIGVIREPVSIASYHSIAERNIFNPERKDFPVTGSESAMRPAVRPQVILYGVTIAKDYQSASVVNPGRPLKKGERDLMTLKLGERIGEYKLTKILPDRISLEAAGDAFEVLLYDPKAPKRRMGVKTESKPATVTSTQPAPVPSAAGATPSAPPAGSPFPATPPTSVQAPKPATPREQVATPPPNIPAAPVPSPGMRRGRRPVYTPPPSTPTPGMGEY